MQQQMQRWFHYSALLSGVLGLLWLILAYGWQPEPIPLPTAALQTELTSGSVATMDSPLFEYSPRWIVNASGADTQEPPDPWLEPSGIVKFQYQGQELALQLAIGNYWGYLYVTVDGEPANLLPNIHNNQNSQNQAAGYRTFYAPEKRNADGSPAALWIPVHRSTTEGLHDVEVEIWRSWGQVPLRGVAVDGLSKAPRPLWPGVAFLIGAVWLWLLGYGTRTSADERGFQPSEDGTRTSADERRFYPSSFNLYPFIALCAAALLIIGIVNKQWIFSLSGYGLLAIAALWQPALWTAMIFFSLPFYFAYDLPLLPNRSFNLIEMGILGGLAVIVGRELLRRVGPSWVRNALRNRVFDKNSVSNVENPSADGELSIVAWLKPVSFSISNPLLWLWALVSWSLISALAADYIDLALYEWRTVFLAGGLLSLILLYTLQSPSLSFMENRTLVIGAWLIGGTVVSLVSLWHYTNGTSLITAEDVSRVRAFYGSPNNLALYLGKTVMVGAALTLFSSNWRTRLLWGAFTLPQAVALLLTYSRGAIILGIPTGCVILLTGAWWLSRTFNFQFSIFNFQFRHLTLFFLTLAICAAGLILFFLLGTTRLQQTLDFSQGTGFLRLQMWRSAWQMAGQTIFCMPFVALISSRRLGKSQI